jgi:23S rRNA (guanosine2251-2'-O)-methyltransferase
LPSIYGLHAVESLLRTRPETVRQLWLQQGRNDKRIGAVADLAAAAGVPVSRLPRQAMDERVDGRHQGVIAEVVEGATSGGPNWGEKELFAALDVSLAPVLLLVLDGVTDPHNLGACLRSADAAGVAAVIVPRDRSADLNPTVRKVACGAAEVVPLVRVTNLARTLDGLKARGVWLYGAAGEATTTLYDNDLTGPLALVMGAEGAGLRRLTRERCDFLVSLPMAGSVSSLNVSVATGICLFEVVRQRRAAGGLID